jgi:hypothetical protein
MTTILWKVLAALLAPLLIAGCGSIGGGPLGGTVASTRTFEAPMTRVKPAVVSTLASMGMRITSLDAQGARETIRAKKGASGVRVELESLGRASTRMRVAADGGPDESAGAKVLEQTAKLLASG